MKDKTRVLGRVRFVLRDEKTGEVKRDFTTDNLITTVGLTFIASRMDGVTSTAMGWMAVGTGTTAANVADTTVETETARVVLDSSTPSTNTVVYVATFPAGTGTGALTEAGVLNAASAGDLLCHTIYTVINKAAGDSLTITWTVTVS